MISLVYASAASAMVTVTKHNFSAGQTTGNTTRNVYLNTQGVADAKGEVCVFCHTPHGADTRAPLWNRQMATAGSYSPYNSSTIDAPGANADRQPKGISLACLSCHDGTIAIDALRNAPGPGNYDDAAPSRNWAWVGLGGTQTVGGNNSLPEDGRITNLTRDLRTQHPISIEYPNYNSIVYDVKFYAPNATLSSGARYFDETGPNYSGGADGKIQDNEVRLYVTNSDSKVYVECASCHNPHGTEIKSGDSAISNDGVNYNTFLRKSNNQSALCTTCHIK